MTSPASPEIIASARSSIVEDGAQMPSGAWQVKLPFTLPPKVVQPFRLISVPKPSAATAARRPRRGALTTRP
jgi:hypothetical protein